MKKTFLDIADDLECVVRGIRSAQDALTNAVADDGNPKDFARSAQRLIGMASVMLADVRESLDETTGEET